MLVEVLLAVPLTCRTCPGPAAPLAERLASFFLDGTLRPAVSEPELSAGAVLARLHKAAKAVDPGARVTAGDGATDVFEAAGAAAPAEGLEAVPPAWQEGLLGGTARVALRYEGLAASVTARLATRTVGAVPPLRLVVRGVRADLLPAEGDDLDYGQALGKALQRPGAFRDLRAWLAKDAERLADTLAAAFADACDAPAERRTRVRVVDGEDGLEDLVLGLPPGTVRHLSTTGDWFRLRRPLGVEVLRHTADGGMELWRGDEVARG